MKQEDRSNYYQVLSQADAGEYEPLVTYFAELTKRSLNVYLRGAKGESLVETEDIDKEIALFKRNIERGEVVKEIKNRGNISSVISDVAFPLFQLLQEKYMQFDDLFFSHEDKIAYEDEMGVLQLAIRESKTIIDKFLKEYENIREIRYGYFWEGFKKARNPFSLHIICIIHFSQYQYSIEIIDRLQEIKKLYHEYLTPEEMNLIVKEVIGKVMEEIKQKSQAS